MRGPVEGRGTVEGKGRAGRGAKLAHSKHMLHRVRQEHFTYTHVSVVRQCAKIPNLLLQIVLIRKLPVSPQLCVVAGALLAVL